jgi:predicted MPP superfamily phosphohydrolase
MLARLSDNIFTNFLYLLSALWIGILVYLLIGLSIACLTVLIFKNVYPPIKMIMALTSLICSLGLVGYAYWNARHPIITNLNITLENLPAQWQNKTIVQITDLHLGRLNGPKFFQNVVNKVNQQNPDIIVITGDLFDVLGNHVLSFIDLLNQLKAPHGVYFVNGNHESYLGENDIDKIIQETQIRVLNDELVEIDGLQLVGINFAGFMEEQSPDILQNIVGFDGSKTNILLYHEPVGLGRTGNTNGNGHSALYFGPKMDYSVQKDNNIDLQLSGHTHAGQLWPFTWLAKMIYQGKHYGLFQDGNFQLYVSSGTGTWGPPIRLGAPAEIVNITLK